MNYRIREFNQNSKIKKDVLPKKRIIKENK